MNLNLKFYDSKLKPPQLRVNSTFERHFKELGPGRQVVINVEFVFPFGNKHTTFLVDVNVS